jgi:hypothetical protein
MFTEEEMRMLLILVEKEMQFSKLTASLLVGVKDKLNNELTLHEKGKVYIDGDYNNGIGNCP